MGEREGKFILLNFNVVESNNFFLYGFLFMKSYLTQSHCILCFLLKGLKYCLKSLPIICVFKVGI